MIYLFRFIVIVLFVVIGMVIVLFELIVYGKIKPLKQGDTYRDGWTWAKEYFNTGNFW